MLKMLDTFSGIGGFSLAASWTGGIETIAFCEIEPFCQKVLHKHWPKVPIHTDIKELNGRDLVREHGAIDIICGGPPCQPASCAGLRRGTDDDRWLWPEAIRLVREIHPRWCVFENPTGLLTLDGGLAFEHLLLEMENEGYAVQPVIIPAGGAGAPHLRYRVWIIANAGGERCNRQPVRIQPGQSCQEGFEAARSGEGLAHADSSQRWPGEPDGYEPDRDNARREEKASRAGTSSTDGGTGNMADSNGAGREEQYDTGQSGWPGHNTRPAGDTCGDANADCGERHGRGCHVQMGGGRSQGIPQEAIYAGGNKRRLKSGMGMLADGLSTRLAGHWDREPDVPRVAKGVANRVPKLRGLGNAIVPQVVYPIFQAIVEIERREATS